MTKSKSFNRKNIKPYKGKMIKMDYSHKRKIEGKYVTYSKDVTGVINATGDTKFLFKPNNEEIELALNYHQIDDIKIMKRQKVKNPG